MLTSSAFAVPVSADDTVTVTVTKVTPAAAERTAFPKKALPKNALPKKAAEPPVGAKSSRAARQRAKATRAVKVAKRHIGDPYRWGATGPSAFDCSGLVQFAWRKAGVRLPRTTWSIRGAVPKKVSWRHLKAGDLIFTSGGGHVGMYVGNGKMIHAPRSGARVRIDRLDSYRRRTFAGAVRPGT
ncbi:C40 family peptidase [Sphaerimonospora thailandensis]|uniref:NlpC/P60 domain-containing protein n=1 Tax=Sphaerimonospora thailandensis TaxID=795644 RepID=A0A8J3RAY9_9ACTN|nr:C40 family peptidase [Sphaerimonospora thailandensis]GIH70971.1 hypothetical protein Mth01_32240 [Sphaerimonospora thailandensis]